MYVVHLEDKNSRFFLFFFFTLQIKIKLSKDEYFVIKLIFKRKEKILDFLMTSTKK
jgi:hypothetical protein